MCHRERRKMCFELPKRGLDSWRSWQTAFLCGLVHLFASLSMTSMGIIFMGLLTDFHAEREKASWPVTAIICSMQIISPVFSVLVRMGVTHMLVLRSCTFCLTLSLVLCYFAKSIVVITVLLAIHGACLSGIFMSANVLMAGHFQKQRAAASGMQETIAGLSIFFMPALMNAIMHAVGTTTGLAVLGGIMSGCFVIGVCIKPLPPNSSNNNNDGDDGDDGDVHEKYDETDLGDAERCRKTDGSRNGGRTIDVPDCDNECRNGLHPAAEQIELPLSKSPLSTGSDSRATDRDGARSDTATGSTCGGTDVGLVANRRQDEPAVFSWRTISDPVFLLDVYSFLVVFECFASYIQLTADYSNDVGQFKAAVWMVPIFGVGDMVLRLCSGFLSDAKISSPATLMLIGSLGQCLGFIILSRSSGLVGLFTSALLLGACNGCRVILFIIVLINDFGLTNLSHTFSFANFLIGIATLVKPFLVGYFRDRLGEYIGLFLVLAGLNAFAALCWTARIFQAYRSKDTLRAPS